MVVRVRVAPTNLNGRELQNIRPEEIRCGGRTAGIEDVVPIDLGADILHSRQIRGRHICLGGGDAALEFQLHIVIAQRRNVGADLFKYILTFLTRGQTDVNGGFRLCGNHTVGTAANGLDVEGGLEEQAGIELPAVILRLRLINPVQLVLRGRQRFQQRPFFFVNGPEAVVEAGNQDLIPLLQL